MTQYRSEHIAELARARSERKTMIDQIKTESGCVDCGYNAHPVALDFDHVQDRGEKLFDISAGKGLSWDKILAEIAKCEVRCSNCHRIITEQRRAQSVEQSVQPNE